MIEKNVKNKKIFLVSAISIFVLALSLLMLFLPNVSSVYASASSLTEQRRLYSSYETSYVEDRIVEDKFYDISKSNDNNSGTSADGVYRWGIGANVFNSTINKLVFQLELLNPDYYYTENYSSYTFDLYSANKDGTTAYKIMSLRILNSYGADAETGVVGTVTTIGIKRYSFNDNLIGVSNYVQNIWNSGQRDWAYEKNNGLLGAFAREQILETENAGYDLVYYNVSSSLNTSLPFQGSRQQFIYFHLQTEDLFSNYFVRFSYEYDGDKSGSLDSKIVSSYDVLKGMYDKQQLISLDSSQYQKAVDLIELGDVQEVRVSYLEQIGSTPFATKKYAYVKVPVTTGEIEPSDVAQALGLGTLSIMQTPCNSFVYNAEDDIYEAYYLKNVWLSSKDENGHSANYFLDINTSYRDYYGGLLEDGVMTQGMYEWLWSTMITDYTIIANIDDSNLYGYFGYAVTPEVHSVNSLWNDLFNGGKNFDGIVRHFEYREKISLKAYNKLLEEYQYNWLGKLWNSVTSLFSDSGAGANHYFFYVNSEQDSAFIGENGADNIYDNGGALQNGIEDVGESIGGFFNSGVGKGVIAVVGLVVGVLLITFVLKSIFSVKTAYNQSKSTKRRR